MRILLVGHAYPPYAGGLSHVLYNVSLRLASMGHEVTVLGLRYGGNAPNIELPRLRVIRAMGIAPRESYFAPTHDFIIKFIRLVKEFDPDVVHVHNVGSLITPTTIMLAKNLNLIKRVVLTPHHHEEGSRADTRAMWLIYKPVLRRIIQNVYRIHTVSNFERALVLRDFGVDSVVIPNGVSEDVYNVRREDPDDFIVTYAGRVEDYKRVDLAVKVVAKAQKMINERIRFKVIGNGPAMGRVKRIAKELGVELIHMDFLPRTEYLRELSRSTVFINLSRYEAFSIVTAEALALGVPVIVAKPWGRIFNEFGAKVVDPENIDEAAKSLTNMLSEQPRISAKVPTWSEVVKEYVSRIYNTDNDRSIRH
ncbi:MAG: glycosyltransferase family 4 protein [Vulcanisaeta sp.]